MNSVRTPFSENPREFQSTSSFGGRAAGMITSAWLEIETRDIELEAAPVRGDGGNFARHGAARRAMNMPTYFAVPCILNSVFKSEDAKKKQVATWYN
jgi:hypothetical protein